jgi:antitoxin CptB
MIEHLRKKLIFRSWHRGTREMDLIMGRFATAHLDGYGADELALYEELMKENDPDLYNWITAREAIPQRCQNRVMEQLVLFHNKA